MKKQNVKFVVDAITFLSFIITAITGLVIFFFIPSGVRQGRFQEFLGIQKGAWSFVHDWAGIVMIVFALIYVILYWNVFVCMAKNFFSEPKAEKCEVE